jgi:hypothetical protein
MYDAGFSDGTDDQLEEFELKESNEICIGLDYALESFEGIQTISGFKDKYLELERLRLNHTPPTGLLLTSLNQSKLFINQ